MRKRGGVKYCLFIGVVACICAKSLQSCPTLSKAMDCSLPGSSVLGILQARVLSELPCHPPGELPCPEIEPMSLMSSALTGGFLLPLAPPGKPQVVVTWVYFLWDNSLSHRLIISLCVLCINVLGKLLKTVFTSFKVFRTFCIWNFLSYLRAFKRCALNKSWV